MTVNALKALQIENDFLAGVEQNLEGAKGRQLRGTIWQWSRHDEQDGLRAMMAQQCIFDRELLKSLPANRRIVLHGYERRFFFGKRRTGIAQACVLSPLSHFISPSDQSAPPIGLGELLAQVRKLVKDPRVPHVIGVCSPTGFSEEARGAKFDMPNVTVVLVEPDEGGGWRTGATSESVDPRVLQLFDPEGDKQKVDRVRRMLEEESAALLTGSLSLSSAAKKAQVSESIAKQAFEQLAASDPELKVARKDGEFLLFRGAPAELQEKKPMNVLERIKQLFSSEGREAEKINLLAERRAMLAQRRDRIYEDISKLEEKDAGLLAQGKASKSQVPKLRLAAQLEQLRKDIKRQNTVAGMLNQQINIISTNIQNLTLIRQGEMAQLPDTDELTQNAVRAEELLESLKADSDLVGGLEASTEEAVSSDEMQAILCEFEEQEQPAPPEQPEQEKSSPIPVQFVEPEPANEPEADESTAASPQEKDRAADAEPT